MESKYSIYKQIVQNDKNYTKNFLDGLLYLNEFSFLYNILKNIDEKFDIIPSFTYTEETRKTPNECMRELSLRVYLEERTMDEIISCLNNLDGMNRFDYSCSYTDDIITISLD